MYCNCMSKSYIALYQEWLWVSLFVYLTVAVVLLRHDVNIMRFYVGMDIEQHQISVANAHPLPATTTDIKDWEKTLWWDGDREHSLLHQLKSHGEEVCRRRMSELVCVGTYRYKSVFLMVLHGSLDRPVSPTTVRVITHKVEMIKKRLWTTQYKQLWTKLIVDHNTKLWNYIYSAWASLWLSKNRETNCQECFLVR